jgi:hypothetical protein
MLYMLYMLYVIANLISVFFSEYIFLDIKIK